MSKAITFSSKYQKEKNRTVFQCQSQKVKKASCFFNQH